MEIGLATKEIYKPMSSLKASDVQVVKKMCRFFKGMPRSAQRIPFENHPPTLIQTYVDRDLGWLQTVAGSPQAEASYLLVEEC